MAFFWIIPNKLAGASAPWGIDDLKYWWSQGIRAVVILLEDYEMDVTIDSYRDVGFDVLWKPIKDMTAPDMSTLLEIVRWINKKIEEKKPVLVHCYGGLGRTGTILAAYLVYKGMDPMKAVEFVRSVRPGAIQTISQLESVVLFKDFLEGGVEYV